MSSGAERLQREIEALAAGAEDYTLGVAVTDADSGVTLAALNAERPFQLASIFKIAVLVTALRRVDAGALSLDARHPIAAENRLIGSGILSYLDAGIAPTLRDLLTLMIVVSDNTATDRVLGLLGGPGAVTAALDECEIDGIQIRHTTRDLLWAVFPAADALPLSDAEFARYRAAHDLPRLDHLIAPDAATNVASAAALNRLLIALHRGDCASPGSTALMKSILARQTYNQRLPRFWPEEVAFAHKTGTLGAMRGDCGLLSLPDRTVAISALLEATGLPLPLTPEQDDAADRQLAEVGRAIYGALR